MERIRVINAPTADEGVRMVPLMSAGLLARLRLRFEGGECASIEFLDNMHAAGDYASVGVIIENSEALR